jgi:hypothetical protein
MPRPVSRRSSLSELTSDRADGGLSSLLKTWPKQEPFTWAAVMRRGDTVLAAAHASRHRFVLTLKPMLQKLCGKRCRVLDVGTVGPTSDYDITVEDGVNLRHLRTEANLLLARTFESPVLTDIGQLDVNIYTHTWYMLCQSSKLVVARVCRSRTEVPPSVLASQLAWSGVRLYKTQPAWCEANLPRALVDQTSAHCLQWDRDVAEGQTNALRASVWDKTVAQMEQRAQAALTAAGAAGDAPAVAYYSATSRVAALAPDAYMSYGAYAHVVLQIQGKHRVTLFLAEYAMSALDNMGFLAVADTVPHAFKYAHRVLDAVHRAGRRVGRRVHRGAGLDTALHPLRDALTAYYTAHRGRQAEKAASLAADLCALLACTPSCDAGSVVGSLLSKCGSAVALLVQAAWRSVEPPVPSKRTASALTLTLKRILSARTPSSQMPRKTPRRPSTRLSTRLSTRPFASAPSSRSQTPARLFRTATTASAPSSRSQTPARLLVESAAAAAAATGRPGRPPRPRPQPRPL